MKNKNRKKENGKGEMKEKKSKWKENREMKILLITSREV